MHSFDAGRARRQATLAALGAIALWIWLGGIAPSIVSGLTCGLALIAWISPPRYAPIQRVLDRLVQGILRILTWLILGLVYLCLFTPMRFWRFLTKQDPLHIHRRPAATTYFHDLPAARPDRFTRQF